MSLLLNVLVHISRSIIIKELLAGLHVVVCSIVSRHACCLWRMSCHHIGVNSVGVVVGAGLTLPIPRHQINGRSCVFIDGKVTIHSWRLIVLFQEQVVFLVRKVCLRIRQLELIADASLENFVVLVMVAVEWKVVALAAAELEFSIGHLVVIHV